MNLLNLMIQQSMVICIFVSAILRECSSFSYSYQINYLHNHNDNQYAVHRNARQQLPEQHLVTSLDRNRNNRFEHLCEYGQKGVYVGYLSDRMDRCYYLCGNEKHRRAELSSIVSESEPEHKQLYHCCPKEARLDFNSKFCISSVDNPYQPKRLKKSSGQFVAVNRYTANHNHNNPFIERNVERRQNRNFHIKRKSDSQLETLYLQNVQSIRDVAAKGSSSRSNWNVPNYHADYDNRFARDDAASSVSTNSRWNCNQGKNMAHPTKPDRYYYCAFDRFYVEMKCPSGLVWNNSVKICLLKPDPPKTFITIPNQKRELPGIKRITITEPFNRYSPTYDTKYVRKTPPPSLPSLRRPPPPPPPSSFVTTHRRRVSKYNPDRIPNRHFHQHRHRFHLSTKGISTNVNKNKEIPYGTRLNHLPPPSSKTNLGSSSGGCLNRWQSKFFKRKYDRNCSTSFSFSSSKDGTWDTKSKTNERRKFWNRYPTKSTTNNFGQKGNFIPTTTKGFRPGMFWTIRTTAKPTEEPVIDATTNYGHRLSTAVTAPPTFITTTRQLPVQQTEPQTKVSFTNTPTLTTTTTTKFSDQQTKIFTNSATTTTTATDFPVQQTESTTTIPITQVKVTNSPTITTITEFPVQQTEISSENTLTPEISIQHSTTAATYPTIKVENKILNISPVTITIETSTEFPTSTEFSSTKGSSLSQITETGTGFPTDLFSTTVRKTTTDLPLTELPEKIPEAEALNVTTTTTSTESSQPISTTVRLPEEFEENSACYDPGARYRDSGDCQCFYYCHLNGQLSRSCCPEGQFFNQIETKPENVNEENYEDDENQYCDIQDNIQCKTTIQ